MKYVLAYVKRTLDYNIIYYWEASLQPIGFVDSDLSYKQYNRLYSYYLFFFEIYLLQKHPVTIFIDNNRSIDMIKTY